jgi:threonine dehydratase
VRRVGERTLELVKRYVDDIVLVDDEEVAAGILFLLEREKTVAEGAGAAPISALLHDKLQLAGKKVVTILCGGNIDVNVISRIIERGLVKSGRLIRLVVAVPDVFGSLARLTAVIAAGKANIVQIHHERAFAKSGVNEVVVELVLETRGPDHGREIASALAREGYSIHNTSS